MTRHNGYTVGIDIGTHTVKIIIGRRNPHSRHNVEIIGTGYAESRGLRRGYIVDSGEIKRAVHKAVAQAARQAGVPITSAYLAIGGVGLESLKSQGSVMTSRADNKITDLDIEKLHEVAEENIPAQEIANRKILHVIPQLYVIDDKKVLGRPQGMLGVKMNAEMLYITCLEQHLEDLVQAVEDMNINVVDVIAAPLAASIVSLSKTQKIAGCVLANIGSETVSIVVYEDDVPIALKVFPIGSTDITNDIALGLKIPLEEAEHIKRGGVTGTHFSRKELERIIESKLSDIFQLIDAYLEEIGKDGMLPAGIILTGGGTGIATIEELSKALLRLPAQVADTQFSGPENKRVRDSSWSVAYGLTVIGTTGDGPEPKGSLLLQKVIQKFNRWIQQFLP